MRYLLVTFVIFISGLTSCAKSETAKVETTKRETAKVETAKVETTKIEVCTYKGESVELNNYSTNIILLFSGDVSCSDCYRVFARMRKELDSKLPNPVSIVVLLPHKKEKYDLRAQATIIKNLLKQDSVFYDKEVTGSDNTMLFDKYHVEYTPSVLLIQNQRVKYIDYSEAFSNDKQLLETIYNFFK